MVFTSKKSTGDYHDEMNSENFEKWFHDILLPKVEPTSIIVMDSASNHSRYLQASQDIKKPIHTTEHNGNRAACATTLGQAWVQEA